MANKPINRKQEKYKFEPQWNTTTHLPKWQNFKFDNSKYWEGCVTCYRWKSKLGQSFE